MGDRPNQADVKRATAETEAAMHPQSVPINMYEAPEAIVIVAPLPAVTAADVTVERTGDTVRFWSHLRSAAPRDYLLNEWSYGGYEREVQIPSGFGAGIDATLANGQLAIRVLRGDDAGPCSVHPRPL